PTLDVPVRQKPAPGAAGIGKVQLVGQKEIADEQSVLHRFGGHTKSLHHERNHKYHDDRDGKERLEIEGFAARSGRLRRGSTGEISLGSWYFRGEFFRHRFLRVHHAFCVYPRRCSKACLAASCSAFFLVAPSPRAT